MTKANGDKFKNWALGIMGTLAAVAIAATAGMFLTVKALEVEGSHDAEDIAENKAEIKENEQAIDVVGTEINAIKIEQVKITGEMEKQGDAIDTVNSNVKRILDKLNDSP